MDVSRGRGIIEGLLTFRTWSTRRLAEKRVGWSGSQRARTSRSRIVVIGPDSFDSTVVQYGQWSHSNMYLPRQSSNAWDIPGTQSLGASCDHKAEWPNLNHIETCFRIEMVKRKSILIITNFDQWKKENTKKTHSCKRRSSVPYLSLNIYVHIPENPTEPIQYNPELRFRVPSNEGRGQTIN